MAKASIPAAVSMPKTFTDVLFMADQGRMPREIRRLLKQKKLSFIALPINKFPEIMHRIELIGTVIIDAEGLNVTDQQKLARIIESLEAKNIGVTLLRSQLVLPVKSFSLSGPHVKSFSLTTSMESVFIDELWVRISVNLAYRKKSSKIAVKPAVPKEEEIIHNNKLAEQLRMTGEMVGSLTEQLRMAGLVQRDFLPAQIPNTNDIQWASCFLPAEWVSGDIYDVVRIDEQHFGFYIADAVGHSMPAALLTIFLKQAIILRETIGSNYRVFSPAEVIKNLNVKMAAQKLSGYQFATACYCMLDVKTLQLTFARAGHPYPILIRPGQPPQQLEIRGSLLGIFEQADYVQQTIQLQRGDKVLLYSDGLEPYIGQFEDLTGFSFSKEFFELRDMSIVEMFDKINQLVQSKKVAPSEVDDITAVGVEIL